jgi:hypothetical protein
VPPSPLSSTGQSTLNTVPSSSTKSSGARGLRSDGCG